MQLNRYCKESAHYFFFHTLQAEECQESARGAFLSDSFQQPDLATSSSNQANPALLQSRLSHPVLLRASLATLPGTLTASLVVW